MHTHTFSPSLSPLSLSLSLAQTDLPRPQQTSENGWRDADGVCARSDFRSFPFLPSSLPTPTSLSFGGVANPDTQAVWMLGWTVGVVSGAKGSLWKPLWVRGSVGDLREAGVRSV